MARREKEEERDRYARSLASLSNENFAEAMQAFDRREEECAGRAIQALHRPYDDELEGGKS